MSLEAFELFCSIAGRITVAFEAAMFCVLWNIFYRRGKDRETLLSGGVLILVQILLDFVPGLPRGCAYLISAVLIIVHSVKKFGRHIEKSVLAITLFYGFRSMDFMISNSVYQVMNNFLFASQKLADPDEMYIRLTLSYAVFNVLYLLVFSLMLLILGKVIKQPGDIGWYDVVFLSVLNIAGGLFMNLVLKISIVPLDTDVFLLYDNEKSAPLLLSAIAVLLFAGEMSAIAIFQRYRLLQAEREVYFAEKEQIKAMKQRLTEAETFYGSIKKVRHDMKSHMTTIKGLAATEHYDELEAYIGKLDETIGDLDYRISTGNAVTDVIVNDRYKRAKKEGIRVDIDFWLDESDSVPVFDLGIVLANLLDNAVEACRNVAPKQRFIRLDLQHSGNFLLITVENSFDGAVNNGADGLPGTSKDTKLPELLMEHGVGLRNVREVAERHFGAMEIYAEENVFKIKVMLQQHSDTNN